MRAVKVQYTVRPDFAERNKANIRRVMDGLRDAPISGLKYAAFTLDDGHTFVHLNIARDAETLAKFTEMEAFKAFQAALKEGQPVSPPQPQTFHLVGASFEI